MPSSQNNRTLGLAALVLVAATLFITARVSGNWQGAADAGPKFATADLLTLLEDMLQTDDYKPARDAYRGEWETQLEEIQGRLQRIETELRMGGQQNPNARALQQQYQQTGFEFQQIQRDATLGFDQFNAEQAAEAYQKLQAEARSLAKSLGYSHLFVNRENPMITERGNLATVTQEILARPLALSPEDNDLTARIREQMSIPVAPEPTEAVDEDGPVDIVEPAESE